MWKELEAANEEITSAIVLDHRRMPDRNSISLPISSTPSNWYVYEGSGTKIAVANFTGYDGSQKCVRISDDSKNGYAKCRL